MRFGVKMQKITLKISYLLKKSNHREVFLFAFVLLTKLYVKKEDGYDNYQEEIIKWSLI